LLGSWMLHCIGPHEFCSRSRIWENFRRANLVTHNDSSHFGRHVRNAKVSVLPTTPIFYIVWFRFILWSFQAWQIALDSSVVLAFRKIKLFFQVHVIKSI
jgi:hypothetical protein